MDSVSLNKEISQIGRPFPHFPSTVDLKPGERIRFFGSIDVQNDTDEPIRAFVDFNLHRGFFLTVDGLSTGRHAESRVSMRETYAVRSGENLEICDYDPEMFPSTDANIEPLQ